MRSEEGGVNKSNRHRSWRKRIALREASLTLVVAIFAAIIGCEKKEHEFDVKVQLRDTDPMPDIQVRKRTTEADVPSAIRAEELVDHGVKMISVRYSVDDVSQRLLLEVCGEVGDAPTRIVTIKNSVRVRYVLQWQGDAPVVAVDTSGRKIPCTGVLDAGNHVWKVSK